MTNGAACIYGVIQAPASEDSVLPLFPGRGKRHTVFQKLDVPGVNFNSCVG